MTDFKVGDRARYIYDGDEGDVTRVSDSGITVNFVGDGECSIWAEDLELISGNSEEAVRNRAKSFTETVLKFSESDSPVDQEQTEEIATLGEQLGITSFEQNVRYHTNKIADLLISKNAAYGNAALNPVNVFSGLGREEQIRVRIDDKISRIQKGTDYANEDTIDDLIGYLFLLKIAKESA